MFGSPRRQSPAPAANTATSTTGLYFRPDEAPALRRKFESAPHRAARWRTLLRNADELLREPTTKGAIDIGRTRSALGNAGITAFAFALTGNRPYADRALAEANGLLAADKWTKPAPANRGANLGTGEASLACALVYDWCAAVMSDADRAQFRDRLFALGIQPYLDAIGPFKDWWRDNDVTNWTGVVNGGCGLAALALYDDLPAARPAAQFAWDRIATFLKTANRLDGGGDEGVMYYTYGMLFANYFAVAAARRFGGDDRGVFRDAVDKMCGYYLAAMQSPGGKYANFNDMEENTFADLPPHDPEGGPNATLCSLWDAKTPGGGDRLLAWAADHGGDNYYWRNASPFALLFRGDSAPVSRRPALQKSILFRESGQAVWDAAPGLWFAFNGGWTSDRSHYNLDLGSFVLDANGERLIHDPGYGKVKSSDHSTLLVDGQEQIKNVRGNYRAWAAPEGAATGGSVRWLACDLSTVYGPQSPLTHWVRHAVLLEGAGHPPLLVLLDDMAASRPINWETRLQIKTDPLSLSPSGAFVPGKSSSLAVSWLSLPATGSDAAAAATPETHSGKGASTYLAAVLPARPAARLATILLPLPNSARTGVSDPATLCPKVSASVAAGNGVALTIAASTSTGPEQRLLFAPAEAGGLRLASVDGRPVANTPGPVRRSLRRV